MLSKNSEQPTTATEANSLSTDSLTPTVLLAPSAIKHSAAPRPTIEGYEILDELGRGGMGIVYKALQTSLNRTVALKMVLAGVSADSHALIRFLAEAQSIARLQHPHIVQVYEVGEYDGQPFFSMEFVDGGSLSQKLAGTPQAPRSAAETVLRLARAMQAAHDRGIIHRDLKPANVLIAADGSPKITDFGLAKQLGAESGQTQSGDVLGTPSYMAPEQALGNVRGITPATDVYALGAILYELLCGRPPQRGQNTVETLRMVVSQEPPAPSTIVSQTPRDLETICLKCLQKEPSKRYATADALADDLQRFLNGEPILARPVSTTERFWRWCRRNPIVAALTMMVFVALSVGTVVATHFAWKASERAVSEGDARQRAERKEREASDAAKAERIASELARIKEGEAVAAAELAKQKEAEAITAAEQEKLARSFAEEKQKEANAAKEEVTRKATELERQVYRGAISLAHRELQADNALRASQLLQQTDTKQRGWEWSYLWRAVNRELLVLKKDPTEEFRGVAYSPDGIRLAAAGGFGTVVVWDATTGREIFSVKLPRDGKAFAYHLRTGTIRWTPDGTRLVAAGLDNSIKLLDSTAGTILKSFTGFTRGVASVVVSPDGRSVAGSSGEEGDVGSYEVRVFDIATGQLVSRLLGHTHALAGVAWSPDGQRLATAGGDHLVKFWNPGTGEELRTLAGHRSVVNGVAFSPDGRRLVSSAHDGLVIVWDVATAEKLLTLADHNGPVTSAVFSPDGLRIASGGHDGRIKLWDARGRLQFSHSGHAWSVMSVAFSPDGSQVASAGADRSIRVWDATADRQFHKLGEHRLPIRSLALDRSAKQLVTLGSQTSVFRNEYALWDLRARSLQRCDRELTDAIYRPFNAFDISADGRLVVAAGGAHTNNMELRLWEAESGRETWKLTELRSNPICCAFQPESQQIAVSFEDGRIEMRDIADGHLLSERKGHETAVPHLRFSSGGEWLATMGLDLTLIWDRTGSVKQTIGGRGATYRNGYQPLSFRQDGKLLAMNGVLNQKGEADLSGFAVFDIESGKVISRMGGHTRPITSLEFAPSGNRIASGSDDNTIKIWDAATGAELLTLRGHTAAVNGLRFTPDGTQLISAGADGAVLIWDATPRISLWLPENAWPAELKPIIGELRRLNPQWPGAVREARSDAGRAIHLDLSGHLALANISPLAKLTALHSLELSETRIADLSPLSQLPLKQLRVRQTFVRELEPLRGQSLELIDVRETAVKDFAALTIGSGNSLKKLWCDLAALSDRAVLAKLPSLQQVNEIPLSQFLAISKQELVLSGHAGDVRSVSLHHDGQFVASAGIDGTVRLWNIPAGTHTLLAELAERRAGPLTWSADGKSLVWCECAASDRIGSELVVWDATQKKIAQRHTLDDRVLSLAAHPQRREFVCGSDSGRIRLLSFDSADELAAWSGPISEALSVAISHDGETLAAGFGLRRDWTQPGQLRLWKLADHTELSRTKFNFAVRWLSFSPETHQLAYAGSDRLVRVVDRLAPQKVVAQVIPHDGRPREFQYLSKSLIASVGEDISLFILPPSPVPAAKPVDTVVPTELPLRLQGHLAPLWSVSASADGQTLATGSADGTIRVWQRPR